MSGNADTATTHTRGFVPNARPSRRRPRHSTSATAAPSSASPPYSSQPLSTLYWAWITSLMRPIRWPSVSLRCTPLSGKTNAASTNSLSAPASQK